MEARKEGQTKRKEFVYYSSSLIIIQSIVNRPTDPSPINSPTQNAVVCSAALDYYYVVNIDPSLTHSLAYLVSQSVSQSGRRQVLRHPLNLHRMPDSLLGLGSACSTATSGVGCTSLGGCSHEYVGVRVRPPRPHVSSR